MAEYAVNKIDDLLLAATEEYRYLNEINVKTLKKLGIYIDNFDPDTLGILKKAVGYLRKCDLQELSKEKFKIWYMQKVLEDSELQVQISDLTIENRNVANEIKQETELCAKMNKNIEEMEKILSIDCSDKNAKEIITKNNATIEMFGNKLKHRPMLIDPNLQIPNIEKRIEELENLRKTLEQKTRIAENRKMLESCKDIVKK